jgi:hypothetical protein
VGRIVRCACAGGLYLSACGGIQVDSPAPAPSGTPAEQADAAVPVSAVMDGGATCMTDLSGIGTANFHISFRMQSIQTGLTTLVYQRAVCDRGEFWDVRMNPGGILGVEVDNGTTHYALVRATKPVNDGALHSIAIARVEQILSLTVDGSLEAQTSAPASFGSLPRLGARSGDPCELGDGTTPLVGSLTDLCITTP